VDARRGAWAAAVSAQLPGATRAAPETVGPWTDDWSDRADGLVVAPVRTAGAESEEAMSYMPRDVGGEDKSGGTMRGKVVYAYCNDAGEMRTYNP
jgi:hypothetical protein